VTERMKQFLQKASADAELAAKIGTMGREELIALGETLGVPLTAADLESLRVQELDDDDLDDVAGGGDVSCACALGGSGRKDANDNTCACTMAGAGYVKGGRERCVCDFAGYGYDT